MRWQTDQNQRVKVSFLAAVLAASSGSVLATDLNIADGTVSDKTYTDIVQIFGNKTEGSLTLSNVSVSTDETSILVAAQSGSSFTINGASQIISANSAAVVFGVRSALLTNWNISYKCNPGGGGLVWGVPSKLIKKY